MPQKETRDSERILSFDHQLVHLPGYMVNYGLGSVLTADIREHTREALGPFETGNPQWFSWTSNHLLRFSEEIDTSVLLWFMRKKDRTCFSRQRGDRNCSRKPRERWRHRRR
jgi:hypothetical protein